MENIHTNVKKEKKKKHSPFYHKNMKPKDFQI